MRSVVFFVLGQKGHEALRAALASGNSEMVSLVVVGKDSELSKDFFSEICDLCDRYRIKYCRRDDVSEIARVAASSTAISAGWRWLINYNFIQIIVFHDSLLPRYRGFNPLVTAVLNRDAVVGVTAIIANKEYDCGDIIDRRSVNVNYPTRIQDVIAQVADLYFDLSRSVIECIKKSGDLMGAVQNDLDASYSVWRDEDDYRIDWNCAADFISHFVKCVSFPYKGASAVQDGRIIRILEAETENDLVIANRDVGKVIFVLQNRPVIICGVGLLRIDAAVDELGRSVLPFKSFRVRLR